MSFGPRASSFPVAETSNLAAINGENSIVSDDINITEFVNASDLLPLSPPVSFEKFLTMQVCAMVHCGDSEFRNDN